MTKLDKLIDVLQNKELRITQSRIAVAKILICNMNTPLTPEEVYNKIKSSKEHNCDQASVYRNLATFDELGMLKKSIFQGEATRYALHDLESNNTHHHVHYFKCNTCNIIEPFSGCLISKKEKELEKIGYKNLHHHLEITGLCPRCAKSA
jgi:Fur family transcriptional regulator, ferric uptake regulator